MHAEVKEEDYESSSTGPWGIVDFMVSCLLRT